MDTTPSSGQQFYFSNCMDISGKQVYDIEVLQYPKELPPTLQIYNTVYTMFNNFDSLLTLTAYNRPDEVIQAVPAITFVRIINTFGFSFNPVKKVQTVVGKFDFNNSYVTIVDVIQAGPLYMAFQITYETD
jgi:hypothetical protein